MNPTTELLKMTPPSRAQFPQQSKSLWRHYLSHLEWCHCLQCPTQSRTVMEASFLSPIHEFVPTLCLYTEHLPEITLLAFPAIQTMGTAPSSHSRLVCPCIYMTPMGTFLMYGQLFLKFEHLADLFNRNADVQPQPWYSAKIIYQPRLQHLKSWGAKCLHQCCFWHFCPLGIWLCRLPLCPVSVMILV